MRKSQIHLSLCLSVPLLSILAGMLRRKNPLNENQQEFHTREDVRQFLPDILGKVLARIWIDPEFHMQFSRDPVKTLAKNGVKLPENVMIEFQRENTERPRIVVYEQRPGQISSYGFYICSWL